MILSWLCLHQIPWNTQKDSSQYNIPILFHHSPPEKKQLIKIIDDNI